MTTTTFDYDAQCGDCVAQRPHYRDEHYKNIADALTGRGSLASSGTAYPIQGQVVYVQAKPDGHGMAVTALVFGIVGSVFGIIPLTYVVALACGFVALVLGVIAFVKLHRHGKATMAAWAIALALIALTLGVVGAVIVETSLHHLQDQLNNNGSSGVAVYP